jgi:hypothetical protein
MATLALAMREAPGAGYEPGNEDAVARLWSRAHTLSHGLKTEQGTPFRVLYPGRPGGPAGPDFLDSVIETPGGERVTGDVELHVDAPDWYRHGHHGDPAYNGVILHVVMRTGGRGASTHQSGTTVPIVRLHGPAAASDGGTGLLLASLRSASDSEIEERLDRAGEMRFLAKSGGYAMELRDGEPDQVVYASLLEGLGYAANRRPFRLLAEAVPYSRLSSLRGEPTATRLLAVKSLLLHGAGMLDRAPPEDLPAISALLRRLPLRRPIPRGEWTTSGVRPANHPARRVLGAVCIVDRLMVLGPAESIAGPVRRDDAKGLSSMLSARPFVGAGRARELAANVALPFAHALGKLRGDRDLAGAGLQMFGRLPALQENAVTREMRRLLAEAGRSIGPGGARRQQGLMHLYKSMTRRAVHGDPAG